MRPKSRATVVEPLRSTPVRSSTPAPTALSTSSVRSGVISLIVSTMVVLPTPKPPAMRIFVDCWPTPPATGSKLFNAIEDHLEERGVLEVPSEHRRSADHVSAVHQVADQDFHHRHRKIDRRRDLGHRLRGTAAAQDLVPLPTQCPVGRGSDGEHQGDHVELVLVTPGPPTGHRVGPDQRAGLVVVPGSRAAGWLRTVASPGHGLETRSTTSG